LVFLLVPGCSVSGEYRSMSYVFEVGVSILEREEPGGVSVGYRCPVWGSLLDFYHLYPTP
jgi:hypothetical protein